MINSCAFADMVHDANGNTVKASPEIQRKAFQIAEETMDRLCEIPYPGVSPQSMTYGTFIKCCGRLDLPNDVAMQSAAKAFRRCCHAGLVSHFVLTQLRYALPPETFLKVLKENGYADLNRKGKIVSRDGKRMQRIRWEDLPKEWTRNVEASLNDR